MCDNNHNHDISAYITDIYLDYGISLYLVANTLILTASTFADVHSQIFNYDINSCVFHQKSFDTNAFMGS